MQINSVPNKFEIYQEYYYVTNGEEISYAEALRLFAQMDADEKADFEQYYKDETGYEIITGSGYNLNVILDSENPSNYTSHYINLKYTLDAYAKSNGLIVDSEWAQFSAEEIIQMENNGVNIPQDVIDIAHTIYESTGTNIAQTDAEDGDTEATTEKEPFLNLIPKAEKKIKKCEENNEKIDEKIEDLLPEKQKQEKSLENKLESSKKALDQYESFVKEWRHIQNKVNNGEELTDTEARRYAELTGMLNEDKSQDSGFEIDKREIAKSLNELNILAVLGEKLADETIEIGDTLADYTSKSNYKTTKKQVGGQIGFLRAIIAMTQGKTLAKEANQIGNETKDFTDDTHTSVMNIAQIMEVENSIANTNGTSTQEDAQVAEEQQEVQETAETEQTTETTPTNGEENSKAAATAQTNDTKEEDFIISDENVAKLIEEAEVTNEDLRKQIAFAVESTDTAKSDAAFAKLANEKISKLVKEFNREEEIRKAEIKKREEENVNEQNEIEKLTNEPQDTDNAADDNINKNTIQQHKETIAQNNKEIEGIKAESVQARETFKSQTVSEKETLNKSIPVEDEAFNANSEYKNSQIPAYTAQLDFTNASGITLAKMGAYMFEMGLREAFGLIISRRALWLMEAGQRSMAIGAQAQREAALPYLEKATKSTTEAETLTGEVLNDMTTLDGQITAITGDDTASTPAAKASEQQEENQQTAQAPAMENAEQTPAMAATPAQPEITGAAAPFETETTNEENTENQTEVNVTDEVTNTVETAGVTTTEIKTSENDTNNTQQKNEVNPDELNVNTKNDTAKNADKKEDKEISTDKAGDITKDAEDVANADSKDSEKVLKDTEKDEKQLEKEAKKIEKQMKKDQQQIVKLTKQSQRAAKKQEEALIEFEELVALSEQLIAEDENKQKQAPQPAQNNDEQQGVLATSSFTAGESDNSQQLQTNDERINVLNSEFKLNGNVIKRNSVKIKKLEKSTKANQTKFNKKTKIRTKKIKEAEKKEQEKQKRLAKQLAAVGIAENVFSITLGTGTIMVEYIAPPLCSNPFTAATGAAIMAAGSYMIVIGTYGVAACGVTKAAINIANGNWTAALIGLGTTAVSIAGSFVPGVGAAAGSVLNAVSTGLSVVSSSAELVNNVRAVQGKEANGVFSKISTVAGVASSITNSAATLKDLGKTAGTFGKAVKIAGVVGSAMSSTSQLMTEFGADGKAAELLGMVGGAVSLAASAVQLAQRFSNASEKNEENKEKSANTDTDNTNNTENTGDTDKTNNSEKADNTDNKDKTNKADNADKAGKDDKSKTETQKEPTTPAEKTKEETSVKSSNKSQTTSDDVKSETKNISNDTTKASNASSDDKKSFFGKVFDGIKNVANTVAGAVKQAATAVANAVTSAAKAVANTAKTLAAKMTNTVKNLAQKAKAAFNKNNADSNKGTDKSDKKDDKSNNNGSTKTETVGETKIEQPENTPKTTEKTESPEELHIEGMSESEVEQKSQELLNHNSSETDTTAETETSQPEDIKKLEPITVNPEDLKLDLPPVDINDPEVQAKIQKQMHETVAKINNAQEQNKMSTTDKVLKGLEIAGQVASVTAQILATDNKKDGKGQNKRHARQWTAEEMKRVNRYKRIRQMQQAHAANYRYSA